MKNQTVTPARAAFVLCLLCLAMTGKAADYYFSSTDGDDSRTTAQAQNPATPWKSITKLNAFFASLKGGDNVFFKRGDVFTGTVVATASGTPSAPITLSAYGSGGAPVISGLRSLSAWANTGGNIWEADASFASSAVNVALVNGSPQAIGRYPNAGTANGGYLTLESYSANTSITDLQLSSSPDWTGGEVVIRKNRWVLDRNKITAHSGNTLYYTSQSGYYASNNYGYFIQNHRAALDQAGEWYFNNTTKKFGLYSSGTPTAVEVGAVNTLLSVNNQSYLAVTNLVFKGANANAVELSNTAGVQLMNCEILYSGGNAVLGSGCNGTRVEGCTITGTANSALEFRGSANIVIKANAIKNTGFTAGMGAGDSGSYEAVLIDGDNETIEGNSIENTGYIPITFRGNSNVVKNNFISTYNTVKDDGGGIYTWNNIAGAPPTYGSKITNNIVLNGIGAGEGTDWVDYKAANGIYMDDNTAGVEISGNTVAGCGLYGLYVHNGYGLTITGNTFFNSGSQIMFMHDNYAPAAKIRNVVMNNNVFFSKEAWQLVAEFKTTDNDIASFGNFDNNYYCRPAYENYIINTAMNSDALNLDLAEWKTAYGKDAASRTFPVPAVSYDAIRLEYNASASSKTISLDGTYTDASGTAYNGSITLLPYTSAVLVKQMASSALCPGTPAIKREQWNNTVNGDMNVVPWQTAPSKTTTVTGALETSSIGDAYAARLSGYLCPPQTGNYTFWIAGDDYAELWLSTDGNPANKRKIAAISGYTAFRQWDKSGSQKSASIALQAGTRYYIEVLHKEGGGYDHVSVAWQLPDGNFEGPIAGHRFPSGTTSALQSQSISFAALANVVLGSGNVTLSATASSGLPVSFSLVSGPATLTGAVLTPTGAGTVVIKASQAGNAQYSAAPDVTQQFAVTTAPAVQCSATGTILREQWNNISGTAVSQIPVNNTPSSSSQLTSFEGPVNIADQYGSRIRGYICPPQTGNYTFWIAGDDNVELWLSTNNDPSLKTRIAYHTSWTEPRQWNWYATQKSATVYLIAGTKYYIEALHKEEFGGDNVSVAWQLPDGTMEGPIPGNRLSPFVPAPAALSNQTISFGALQNFTMGDGPVLLTASASSGLPVSFSLVSGSATLNGNTLTPTAAGTVVIKASQPGNSQYNAAPDVTQSLTVLAPAVSQCSATGTILREQWNNVSGTAVSQVPVNNTPSSSSQLTSFEGPVNIADQYGSRIRGYICPPQTGNYTFWIAGDDNVELWLSSSDNPVLKTKIAYHTSWTEPRQWNWYATQKSAAIYLTAGKKYYIEALHKEEYGGDNVSVAWQLPDGTTEAPIPGNRLSPFVVTSVALLNQTIAFDALQNVTLGSTASLTLNASASSGLPVSFSLISGPATLNGNVLTPTAAGTVVIKASQPGNSQYNAAPDVMQSLTVLAPAVSQCSATGTILREQWNNISGTAVSQVPVNSTPSSSSQLTSFEGPINIADQYGSRIRGYICPPQTGNYTFWIAGDDNVELWLSTSDDPSLKTRIAYHTSWTEPRQWNWYATQKSAAIYLTAGKKYYIEALHKEEFGGDNVSVAWQLPDGTTEAPIPGNRLSPYVPVVTATALTCTATGAILREVWNNVDGNDVSQVPQTTPPSVSSQINSFEGPTNVADKYASRIRGYLCAPQSGSYTFYIAGDDATELWLSASDDPSAKVKIAYNLSWTNAREWTRYASQKSAPVYLVAGKKYYIEALHKEGAGSDNLSVAWQLPDGTFEAPIAGSRLSPFIAAATASANGVARGVQTAVPDAAEPNVKDAATPAAPALRIYPNPFKEEAIVEFTPATTGQCVVDVCNALGMRQAVLFSGNGQKGTTQRLTYRPPNLAAGVYFVRYRSAIGTTVYKLLKNRS